MNSDKTKIASGDKLFISKTTIHRLEVTTNMTILEISFRDFDELDIKRLEEDYNK